MPHYYFLQYENFKLIFFENHEKWLDDRDRLQIMPLCSSSPKIAISKTEKKEKRRAVESWQRLYMQNGYDSYRLSSRLQHPQKRWFSISFLRFGVFELCLLFFRFFGERPHIFFFAFFVIWNNLWLMYNEICWKRSYPAFVHYFFTLVLTSRYR